MARKKKSKFDDTWDAVKDKFKPKDEEEAIADAFSPTMSDDQEKEFMEKMLGQGKVFFRMAEQFADSLQGATPAAEWSQALNKIFSDMQAAFSGEVPGMGADSMHKMMAFWELPLDNWQRMVSSLSLVPGDVLRNMPHGADFERWTFLTGPLDEIELRFGEVAPVVVHRRRSQPDGRDPHPDGKGVPPLVGSAVGIHRNEIVRP